jgi:hypothetical protein
MRAPPHGGDDGAEHTRYSKRDRSHVVSERPEEVALDRAQGATREADRVGRCPQVAGHECDVRGLDRDIGACADGDAEVRLRKRRRVVDAVSNHGHDLARALQPLDLRRLLARQHLGEDTFNAYLAGHAVGCLLAVAG